MVFKPYYHILVFIKKILKGITVNSDNLFRPPHIFHGMDWILMISVFLRGRGSVFKAGNNHSQKEGKKKRGNQNFEEFLGGKGDGKSNYVCDSWWRRSSWVCSSWIHEERHFSWWTLHNLWRTSKILSFFWLYWAHIFSGYLLLLLFGSRCLLLFLQFG